MFIDTESPHHFLFVFQRRGSEAGLKLTLSGMKRTATIPPATSRAAEKQKQWRVGCSVYKHAIPTGFPRQLPILKILSNKTISDHLLAHMWIMLRAKIRAVRFLVR